MFGSGGHFPPWATFVNKAGAYQSGSPFAIRVRVKQRIRSPLFERLFHRISVLHVTSRRGEEGVMCYTLAEHYRERIRCFTPALAISRPN